MRLQRPALGRLFSSVLLFALAISTFAAAQRPWIPVGPNGGDARSLAQDPKHPDRIYAGTSAGELYVSNDFARSWERFARIGKGNDFVLDNLAIDPHDGTLYVAAWTLNQEGGALYRSRDHGHTWQSMKGMEGKSIRAMSLAPSDPKTIIVGALDGVFRSRDAGDSWERISPPNYSEIKNVESIAIDPSDPNVIYAGTWHLPWKTSDGGRTWHNVKNGVIDDSDVFSIIIDPVQPSVVYASACSGIYKSENGGELFHKVQGIPATARRTRVLQQDPVQRDLVYAGTTEGLWRTSDAGHNWNRLTGPNVIVNDVLIDPRNDKHILLATDRSGLLYSADGGESFAPANHGYTHRQVATVLVPIHEANTMYVGVLNDKEYGGVFASHDFGETWEQMSTGLGGRDVFTLREAADGTLIAGTNSGIFLRAPHGVWTESKDVVLETETHGPARKLKNGKKVAGIVHKKVTHSTLTARINDIAVTPEHWYAATSSGMYASSDQGKSWRKLDVDNGSSFVSVAARGDMLITAGPTSVAYSMDAGKRWRSSKLPNVTNIVAVAVSPDNTLWVAGREGAFRSTDHGNTWNYLWSLPLRKIAFMQWDDERNRMLATGVDSMELYESADGATWKRIDAGWLLRAATSAHGRTVAATAFDGIVLQPASAMTELTAGNE